jgi:diaminohydroxyphosphoribosylaminopyrimidine deaminase/5-amino-6-(5-phosphoribosylamino)uracil reductase
MPCGDSIDRTQSNMNDETYIRRTLALAEQGAGLSSPGAMVGAVIVRNDQVVGEGFYTYDGVRHAETGALEQAGSAARDATVYTNLEPCSHVGRTPPCAKALIDAGVARVVTAMRDPNPLVDGSGIRMLREAGVEVVCGVLEDAARRLNEAFIVYKTERRPFGILKIAMTIDGKIATRTGESRWITSEESRREVHRLRHRCDAIVTGSGTVLTDNPRLTDRSGLPRRRPLLRVVVDRRGRVTDFPDALIYRQSLEALGPELYKHEIQSFLLECGPDLAFNALRAGIIDKMIVFIAPRVLGGREIPAVGGDGVEKLSDAIAVVDWQVTPSGPDVMLTAYVHRDHRRNG